MTRSNRGSVLLPLIGALLLMLYAGTALTEVFSVQRMRAVNRVQSAQAYWVAEAGAWHAAQIGESISTPVSFGSGSYTVVRDGDRYVSLASRNGTRRVVSATLSRSEELLEEDSGELLDEVASAASAYDHDEDHFHIDLYSLSDDDLQIASFELSANASTPDLEEIKLDNKKILSSASLSLPTGVTALNDGSDSERTIEALDAPQARIKFDDDFDDGTYTFTLVLTFTDGSSDSVTFSVSYDDDDDDDDDDDGGGR